MVRSSTLWVVGLILSIPGNLPSTAFSADIFRWVDDQGVVHFTDNPHNIPGKFRSHTERIKTRETPPSQDQLKGLSLDKVSVPLQKQGEVVVVQATLNERTEAKFVVDTGASYTMISRATAKELEIDLGQKFPTLSFQTANGVVQAPLIKLDSIEVGGLQVRNLTAAVHDVFPDPSISGLLGLNFLSNFRLDIDTAKSVLHLEKK